MNDSFSSQLLREMKMEEPDLEPDLEPENINVKYEIIPGKRKGSKLLWAYEQKQLYYKHSHDSLKNITKYTCCIKNCTARLTVNLDKSAVQKSYHLSDHADQYQEYKHIQCKNLMKEKARLAPPSVKPHNIYMEAIAKWEKDPLCNGPFPQTYEEVRKALSNIRASKWGKAPTDGEGVLATFEEEEIRQQLGFSILKSGEPLFNTVRISDDFQNCIFSSAQSIAAIMNNVPESKRFFILDGTFYISPKGVWQQVLILHASFGLKTFPLVFCLMSRRTTKAYEDFFRYVHENLIPLRGEAIIIDFERAMRRALIKVLDSIDSIMVILGCWFHFCQALRRKVMQMHDLFQEIQSNEKYRDLFRRFQCLPLLPCEKIENAFIDLSKQALEIDRQLFGPFVNYFDKEWIKIVTPKHFCVFNRGKRTTGDAESFNAKLNSIFSAHPNFFTFVETLQKVEATSSSELINFINGTRQVDRRTKATKKRQELIKKLSMDHQSNPKLLLNLLANIKNKLLYEEKDIIIEKQDLALNESVALYGNEKDVSYKEVNDVDDNDLGNLNFSGCSDLNDDSQTCSVQSQQSDEGVFTNHSASACSTPKKRLEKVTTGLGSNAGQSNKHSSRSRKGSASTSHSQRQKKKIKINKNHDGSESSATESSSSSSEDNLVYFSRATRNGNAIEKLIARITKIMDGDNKVDVNFNSFSCIICCEKKKNALLLPCRHQHTCDSCWTIWSIQCISKLKDISFSDNDDNVTKPTCPYCKSHVDTFVSAIN